MQKQTRAGRLRGVAREGFTVILPIPVPPSYSPPIPTLPTYTLPHPLTLWCLDLTCVSVLRAAVAWSCKACSGEMCRGQSSVLTRMGLSVKAEESFIQRRREDLSSEAYTSAATAHTNYTHLSASHAQEKHWKHQ